jgi:hypothetical protein
MTGEGHPADRRTFEPLAAKPPDAVTLAKLSEGGFSPRGLDAVGGVGTSAWLGRARSREIRAGRRRRAIASLVLAVRRLVRRGASDARHRVTIVVGGAAIILALRACLRWLRRR